MKVRDHQKTKAKWPPKWWKLDPTSNYKTDPSGEQGELKEVKGPFIHGPSGHVALVIEYEGEKWHGQIGLDDTVLLQKLHRALAVASTKSMPLRDVGDIDLD